METAPKEEKEMLVFIHIPFAFYPILFDKHFDKQYPQLIITNTYTIIYRLLKIG